MFVAKLYLFEKDERRIIRVDEKSKVSEGIYDILPVYYTNTHESESQGQNRRILREENVYSFGMLSERCGKLLSPDKTFEEQGVCGGDTLIFFRKEDKNV